MPDVTPIAPDIHTQNESAEILTVNPRIGQELGSKALCVTDKDVRKEKFLQERIEKAKLSCEFDYTNPEVGNAIEGFYRDHYELADMIDAAVSGDISDERLEAILTSEVGVFSEDRIKVRVEYLDKFFPAEAPSAKDMSKIIAMAVRQDREAGNQPPSERAVKAATSAMRALFAESSVGISTIGAEEQDTIVKLHEKLFAAVLATGGHELNSQGYVGWADITSQSHTSRRIALQSERDLQSNVMEAQNEFWRDTRHAGQLEYTNTGNTASILGSAIRPRTQQFRKSGMMHALTSPERQEMHSVVPHFSEFRDKDLYKGGGDHPGTIAVPISVIIEHAPFARDAKYAVVDVLDDSVLAKVPKITGEGSIGSGQDDDPGTIGDRVFFASNQQEVGTMPDEYEIPTDRRAVVILEGNEELGKRFAYPRGENYPSYIHINAESSEASLVDKIQEKKFAEQRGRVVVPLRRGVFKFRPENMSLKRAMMRPAPNYNQNPLLSEAV